MTEVSVREIYTVGIPAALVFLVIIAFAPAIFSAAQPLGPLSAGAMAIIILGLLLIGALSQIFKK